MSHITKEQLEHLAMLAKLELSEDQKASLLWDMESILDMVWQLEKLDLEWVSSSAFPHTDKVSAPRSGVVDCDDDFLQNVQHPLQERAIVVKSAIK